MLIEDFKTKYTTIPFATFARNHKKGDALLDSGALLHMHKEMELLYVLEGNAKFYIGSTEYDITKGDTVIVSPYMLHRAKIERHHDFSHRCICFDLELLPDEKLRQDLLSGASTVINIIKNNSAFGDFVNNAFTAHKLKASGWELAVIGNLSLFMGLLKQNGYIKRENAPSQKNIYRKIIEYVHNNYQNDITSLNAAKALHVNNSYFCRIFKKCFGCTFQNYLCMYRIQVSKSLLSGTDFSILEIANKVGFYSISYYSKRFKELNSLTPAEYRKIHKK